MNQDQSTRRQFIGKGLAAGGVVASGLGAAGYARVIGANERINVGLIGCGGRGRFIIERMVKPANKNTGVAAVCDVWKHQLETYPGKVEKLLGARPKAYPDYRRLLESKDVDAVVIATPAHQHCGQTIDAIQAGKHVYVEKPIAPTGPDLEPLNKCLDVVKASKLKVQHGSQGVSCPGARAVRQFIADRKLGRLFRVEATETAPVPYWIHYKGPQSEGDTDWKAFLYNRAYRPFDAHQHASWMGYHDFSSGPIGGWMSHFINFVHFATGSGFPVSATAFGGRFAPTNDPRCDAPDQVNVTLEYAEGFHTQFVTHFGSSIDNESILFMFEKGSLRTRFGHHVGNPRYSSEGVDDKIPSGKLLDFDPPYPGTAHAANWLDCIRDGGQPNADMDFGYKQGIAVIMGDVACTLGRKVVFDQKKREIRPA